MCGATGDVRFGPIADIANLIDRLIGAVKQRGRHGDPERLGSLEIDHQLVLGRCLYREIGGLLALEDAVDIAGGAPIPVDRISCFSRDKSTSMIEYKSYLRSAAKWVTEICGCRERPRCFTRFPLGSSSQYSYW
jgi:hypothetical protein